MNYLIRQAKVSDAATLAELGEKTFRETFAKDNKASDMDHFVRKTFAPELQKNELNDSRRQIFLALEGSVPIAYLHLFDGPVDPSVSGPKPIELLRLYVDRPWQGMGIAHQLMETAIKTSRARGFKTLWLGVWEKNFKAQTFYKKWGFRETGSHIFQLGADQQVDLILELALQVN
ncbi:MAG: GNAT family N-acetyltransferase [Polynucleobacter sp.]|nr:GNAT family N-acetyltransferase [Polynucleobacter sp.]